MYVSNKSKHNQYAKSAYTNWSTYIGCPLQSYYVCKYILVSTLEE